MRIDPRHLIGVPDDRQLVALDATHDPPEAEGPQVVVARGHGAGDPVQLVAELRERGLGVCWSQGFHGWGVPPV
jgi:hypothetical protein